ncbi:MAG: type II toxin-antitoxin system HipA family toxin [Sulfurifustis sp.]
MNGELVGHWDIASRGRHEFRYAPSWLDAPATRPLSLSMPLQASSLRHSDDRVNAFFDNLLPESPEIRRRLQARFGTPSTNAFDLLAEIGRDCVGAVQLLPPDDEPKNLKRIEGKPLREKDVEQFLRRTVAMPTLGQQDDTPFRISLAGVQEKTALLWHNGRWHLPLGATPSTHIFKLPIGHATHFNVDLSASIENEWLCAQIVRAYGLRIAQCEMATFGDQRVLIVERFDRRLASNGRWWLRLPQEDMCQATGTPPGQKYESDGGPGIREIMSLLLGAGDSLADRRIFFKAQIVFWALCAIDGHAKNFSIAIKPRGEYSLTPLYDVISAYPVVGRSKRQIPEQRVKMAMALRGKNRRYHWATILRRHWFDTARACDFSEFVEPLIGEIVDLTPKVIEKVSKLLTPKFPAAVADPILNGLERAVKRLT